MTSPGTPDRPYGPQTRPVRRFLQRLAALPPETWDDIAAAYADTAGSAESVTADRDLARAIERGDRVAARDAVLGPLVQLVRTDTTLPDAPSGSIRIEGAARDEAATDPSVDSPMTLHPVAEAALAAVLALVVRDVLTPRTFATLYAPVAAAIPPDQLDR